MEKGKERVLAYTLAKEIDPKDLDEVSGGSVQPTVKITGSVSGTDGVGDVNVDW